MTMDYSLAMDLKQRLEEVGLTDINIDLCHAGEGGKEKLVELLIKYNDIFSKTPISAQWT